MKLNRGDIVIANLESVSKGSIRRYRNTVMMDLPEQNLKDRII